MNHNVCDLASRWGGMHNHLPAEPAAPSICDHRITSLYDVGWRDEVPFAYPPDSAGMGCAFN